ncbi:Uncharacterized protein HZ326_12421 [Fusarium oxysporum f. sp. albedinis]|nr:Uncharacterized protein HZ326_12421 [Fusarium oxysporum f. sp. albedinis]
MKLPESNKRKVLKFAKALCAHGRSPLHFLSEFDPLISLDGTPGYEITFRSRRWWEDHDPWLDAYQEALKISDEGWKMRDEAMKQGDSVPDDEGADDWDFMCLPIPGYEDVFAMRGVDCFKWWQQECCQRIQDHFPPLHRNYIGVYGAFEVFDNIVAQFDSVFQPNSSYRDFWPEVEVLAMILQRGQLDLNIVKHLESKRAKGEIQDVFKPNSEIRNLGSVLFTFIRWRLDVFCGSVSFFSIYDESLS